MSIKKVKRGRYVYPFSHSTTNQFGEARLCDCEEILCDIDGNPVCRVDGEIVVAIDYSIYGEQLYVKSYASGVVYYSNEQLKMVPVEVFKNLKTLTEICI